MPRPKKRKLSPLESPQPMGATGDGTPPTHPWVAPEPEAEPPQARSQLSRVEVEPEMEPPPQKTEAEKALEHDKAYDDYEKASNEFHRLFTVYSDSEFDSQWGDNAFVARVEQRIAASDSKLLQAEATYFEAATAAERITALESIALKAQTRSLLSTLRYMCVQQEYTAFQRKHIAYLSDLASE